MESSRCQSDAVMASSSYQTQRWIVVAAVIACYEEIYCKVAKVFVSKNIVSGNFEFFLRKDPEKPDNQ